MANNDKNAAAFFESFHFPKIFRAFRISVQPAKLIIAFLAIVVVCFAGRIMDFSKTVVKEDGGRITELHVFVSNPHDTPSYIEAHEQSGKRTGVFSALWVFGAERFHLALRSLFQLDIPGVAENIGQCFNALVWAVQYHTTYTILFFTVTLAVISLAGGAICRIAALQFSQGEKPGLTDAVLFSTRKFTSLFSTPLIALGIVAFIGLLVSVVGFIGNIPIVGELLIGLSMPITLLFGAVITVIGIGAVAGFNLMFPTITYEDSDSFDAISRSFSYVYAKPWRMGFYTVVAGVYGAICYIFVRLFAFLSLWAGYLFVELGVLGHNRKLDAIWPEPTITNFVGTIDFTGKPWSFTASAIIVRLFVLAVIGLLAAFVISFYFSANTIIYALMRNKVDNTALEDVYTRPIYGDTKTCQPAIEFEPESSEPAVPPERPDNSQQSAD